MVKQAEICQLLESLTKEFLLVAQHEGVNISFEEAQAINQKIAVTMSGQRSSTAQDLMKGKPTEIEFLNGLIVRKAQEFGVSTPSHQAMYALVKMFERQAVK
jgi:2-dehydropantoate 2-reductase